MPVPSSMQDLSTLASSNSPDGTEVIGNSLDNYLRALSAIVRSTSAISAVVIASASTTDLASSSGESVGVSGTATITSFGAGFPGCVREVTFTNTATITHSANIQLPNAANITTAAGDIHVYRCKASGVWQLVSKWKPNSSDVVSALGYTPVNKAGDTGVGALSLSSTLSVTGTTSGSRARMAATGVSPAVVDNLAYVASGSYGGGYGFINADNGQCSGIFHEANTLVFITSSNNVLTGSSRATLDLSGNFTASGNITAGGNLISTSDGRVKTNWRDLPESFVDQLARVKYGVYDRTDRVATQVGVRAQDIQRILPHAVEVDADGMLSLAYGNAALVGAIAVAARLVALESRVAELEAR